MTCDMCGGSEQRTVAVRNKYTERLQLKIEPCICRVSHVVSDECKILSPWYDEYIPYNQIDKDLKIDLADKKAHNYKIWSDSDYFYLNVKSILMMNRFLEPRPPILFCQAIEILEKFYVKQNDGTSPSLTDANKYSLLVIAFDTNQKNDQLKTCLAQVVYNRKKRKQSTWIYLPDNRPNLESCTQEYSKELEEYTSDFKVLRLQGSGESSKLTPSHNDAANFGGLS